MEFDMSLSDAARETGGKTRFVGSSREEGGEEEGGRASKAGPHLCL